MTKFCFFYLVIIINFLLSLFSSGHCLSSYPQFLFEVLKSLDWIFVHLERRTHEGIIMRLMAFTPSKSFCFIPDALIRASHIFRITLALHICKMFYNIFIQKLTHSRFISIIRPFLQLFQLLFPSNNIGEKSSV